MVPRPQRHQAVVVGLATRPDESLTLYERPNETDLLEFEARVNGYGKAVYVRCGLYA